MPLFDGRRKASAAARGSSSANRWLIVLCAVSIALCALSLNDTGSGPISLLRSSFSVVAMPFRSLGALVVTPFNAMGNAVNNLSASGETLSELKEENERLLARNAELEEAEQTALRLQALLNLQSTYDLESIGARVISSSAGSWAHTVEIDKGSSSGLAVGMPVLSGSGVVGLIVATGPMSSTVRLLTDENSGVSAMVQSSRAQGMLEGSADGTLHLSMVRSDQTVQAGDMIITSGLGGVFPKGLPLGTVVSVEKKAGQLYLDVVVSPIVAIETNEEVLVVTAVKAEQHASAEEMLEADAQDYSANATAQTQQPAADPAAQPEDRPDAETQQEAAPAEGDSEGAIVLDDAAATAEETWE